MVSNSTLFEHLRRLPGMAFRLFLTLIILAVGVFWYIIAIGLALYNSWKRGKSIFATSNNEKRAVFHEELFFKDPSYGRHRSIDLQDGRVFHIVEAGNPNGPLVLFLHGFPQFWYSWRYQLEGLKDSGYRLVAMDMRGYGTSYVPVNLASYQAHHLVSDVRGVIHHLLSETSPSNYKSRAVALVGHDWGGIVAYHVAADSWLRDIQSEHVSNADSAGYISKLVICNVAHPLVFIENIYAPMRPFLSWHSWLSMVSHPKTEMLPRLKELGPALGQLAKSYYAFIFQLPTPLPEFWLRANDYDFLSGAFRALKAVTDEDDIERYKSAFMNPEQVTAGINYYKSGALLGGWKKGDEKSEDEYGKSGYPTLILWGEKDGALDMNISLKGTERKTPNLTIHKFPNANHFIPEQIHDEVTSEIKHFLGPVN